MLTDTGDHGIEHLSCVATVCEGPGVNSLEDVAHVLISADVDGEFSTGGCNHVTDSLADTLANVPRLTIVHD